MLYYFHFHENKFGSVSDYLIIKVTYRNVFMSRKMVTDFQLVNNTGCKLFFTW